MKKTAMLLFIIVCFAGCKKINKPVVIENEQNLEPKITYLTDSVTGFTVEESVSFPPKEHIDDSMRLLDIFKFNPTDICNVTVTVSEYEEDGVVTKYLYKIENNHELLFSFYGSPINIDLKYNETNQAVCYFRFISENENIACCIIDLASGIARNLIAESNYYGISTDGKYMLDRVPGSKYSVFRLIDITTQKTLKTTIVEETYNTSFFPLEISYDINRSGFYVKNTASDTCEYIRVFIPANNDESYTIIDYYVLDLYAVPFSEGDIMETNTSLNLREQNELESKIIYTLPINTKVKILDISFCQRIDGIDSAWVLCETIPSVNENKEPIRGWCFGGDLENCTRKEMQVANNIKTSANKYLNSPEKILFTDSVTGNYIEIPSEDADMFMIPDEKRLISTNIFEPTNNQNNSVEKNETKDGLIVYFFDKGVSKEIKLTSSFYCVSDDNKYLLEFYFFYKMTSMFRIFDIENLKTVKNIIIDESKQKGLIPRVMEFNKADNSFYVKLGTDSDEFIKIKIPVASNEPNIIYDYFYYDILVDNRLIKDEVYTVNNELLLSEKESPIGAIIKRLEPGTKVKILKIGSAEIIDNLESNWVKVEVLNNPHEDIISGWCYGGYLDCIQK